MKTLSRKSRKIAIISYIIILSSSLCAWTLVNVSATAAPTLLTPSNGSYTNDNTPTATWTSVTGATQYHIQISIYPDFHAILGEDYPATNTFTASPALPDGHYYWRVRAYAAAYGGWSAWSTPYHFYIDTVAPGTPTLIDPHHFEWVNINTLTLDWSDVSGANEYNVRISRHSDMATPHTDINTGSSTSSYYVSTPLAEGYQYWDVRAKDNAGNWGSRSSVFRFQVDTVPPDAATLLSPADGYTGNSITLQCSTASGAQIYLFQIADDETFTTIFWGLGDTGTEQTPTLAWDGTYYWRVRTSDNANNYAFSTTWSFTLDREGPSTPALVSPSNNYYTTDTTPYLDWSEPADAVGYHLQVDTTASFSSPIIQVYPSVSHFTTTTLAEDTYYWRVRAKDAYDNWSGWSAYRTLTVDTTAPDAPVLSTPTDDFETNDNMPLLDWVEVAETAVFKLQVDTIDTFISTIVDQTNIADSYYQIVSSLSDGTYYWRVRATDSAGNTGLWSTIRSFKIDTVGPDVPALVSPEDTDVITDTTPLIVWSTIVDAVLYQLQIDMEGTFVSLEYNETTANTFYSIVSALSGGTYHWRVRARDSATNWGGWSEVWTFTLDLEGPDAPTVSTPSDESYIGDNTPFLSWTSIGDAVEYEFELATEATFGASLLYTTTTSNNYYTIFFTLDDDVYYLRVRAKDASENWGDWSSISIFTVDTTTPSITPQDDIEYMEGETGDTISWSPNDDNPSLYIIYLDGIELQSGAWNSSSEILIVNVEGLSVGTYNFTIYFEDSTGRSGVDTVIVTVTPLIPEYEKMGIVVFALVSIIGLVLITTKRRK